MFYGVDIYSKQTYITSRVRQTGCMRSSDESVKTHFQISLMTFSIKVVLKKKEATKQINDKKETGSDMLERQIE